MKKYAFLDRDGTIIWEPPKPDHADPHETFPLKSMEDFKFLDGAIEGLKILVSKNYNLVMATNQLALGTPQHPKEMFNQVMKRIEDELAKYNMRFEFIMVCPHGLDDGCDCRKPKIGGMKNFLKDRQGKIDFANSFMFGDRDTDGEFAKNLGVRFIKIQRNEKFVLPEGI
jgi:imidazoleglycerol-phosphate dehydratase/histidinol-phosphatase